MKEARTSVWNFVLFDSVPRKKIWDAQEAKGVLRANGRDSKSFLIERGVRQRNSLSPLLFVIFMDEIYNYCTAWAEI